MLASNQCFGSIDDGYFSQVEMYVDWLPVRAPAGGIKLHVSVHESYAEVAARSVLPKLREMRVAHKVVRNLEQYRRQLAGKQGGKFITIYTTGQERAQQVVAALEEELSWLGIMPGPVPTTRDSHHQSAEARIGQTGLIFMRHFSKSD